VFEFQAGQYVMLHVLRVQGARALSASSPGDALSELHNRKAAARHQLAQKQAKVVDCWSATGWRQLPAFAVHGAQPARAVLPRPVRTLGAARPLNCVPVPSFPPTQLAGTAHSAAKNL
jgi:hypothetical protein